MAQHHDVDRFDKWAPTYDQHRFQRLIFEPVHRTLLEVAGEVAHDPKAILDVGCGTGRLLLAAAGRFPGADLSGVDAAPEMVRQAGVAAPAGGRFSFQQATAESLPFQDDSFDLVFSTMTFHHWHDQENGIAEVARVLKPDGSWLLSDFVPTGIFRYARRLLRIGRWRERPELDSMLGRSGLCIAATRAVPGLAGQVPVLAIESKAAVR